MPNLISRQVLERGFLEQFLSAKPLLWESDSVYFSRLKAGADPTLLFHEYFSEAYAESSL